MEEVSDHFLIPIEKFLNIVTYNRYANLIKVLPNSQKEPR